MKKQNVGAHILYQRLGFVEVAEREESYTMVVTGKSWNEDMEENNNLLEINRDLQKLAASLPTVGDLGIYIDLPDNYHPRVTAKEYEIIQTLVFHKKYHEAIEEGINLLQKYPDEGIIEEQIAIAYFKMRNANPENEIFCIEYTIKTLTHNVFYYSIFQSLALRLRHTRQYHKLVQLSDFIKSNEVVLGRKMGIFPPNQM